MKTLDSFRLTGRKAFVTGGARGIGKSAALAFAEAGADVAIIDVEKDAAQETAAELTALGVKSIAVVTDVTDPAAVDRMMAEVLKAFGTVDIAFNNAGLGVACSLLVK